MHAVILLLLNKRLQFQLHSHQILADELCLNRGFKSCKKSFKEHACLLIDAIQLQHFRKTKILLSLEKGMYLFPVKVTTLSSYWNKIKALQFSTLILSAFCTRSNFIDIITDDLSACGDNNYQ